jgi:RNAse (barnase) inhibitor barstar
MNGSGKVMRNRGKEITREEILVHWRQGKTNLDWRQLTDNGKGEWLQACLAWSGLPATKIKSLRYTIDGDHVNSHADFYCLLGETFFGYRGYFGQDADGFDDCFCEISIQTGDQVTVEPGAKVILKNAEQMKAALPETFPHIIQILTEQGFDVELP